MVKIRICGGAGSGKSTLAARLAKEYGIPHYDLDYVFFTDEMDYGKFRDEEGRDKRLKEILENEDWIIEGTYTRDWAKPTFEQADKVIFIRTPMLTRQYRVIKRWVRGKAGLTTRREGTLLQLLSLLKYEIGSEKRHLPRLEKMNIHDKLIVIRKIEEYR